MTDLDHTLYQAFFSAYGHSTVPYGTAGFRSSNEKLGHIAYRLGQFVGLLVGKVREEQPECVLGVMITASHNQREDNGFKVINYEGEMLEPVYEQLVTDYVNGPSETMQAKRELLAEQWKGGGHILVGRDNRPSSGRLEELFMRGVESVGSTSESFGEQTTPQLHFYTSLHNLEGISDSSTYLQTYQDRLVATFNALVSGSDSGVTVDAANGVGGRQLHSILERLNTQVHLVEWQQDHRLNDACGSEHVQKNRLASSQIPKSDSMQRCCAFDGDCDRLIYFGVGQQVEVIEGDKMMVLWLMAVRELLHPTQHYSLGAVQTAYANGASSLVIQQLGVQVSIEPTGVKYLHKKAREFDIGVYFESNGHGTILTKAGVLEALKESNERLYLFLSLANQ